MKFGQFMYNNKIKVFIKKLYEKCDLEISSIFEFVESVEGSMLIWTNFDSFAIIYI